MAPTNPAPAPPDAPYWWQAAPRPVPSREAPPTAVDAVIVGSGLTGLNAALEIARGGRSVVVVEAQALGFGASTRNAGFVSRSFKHGFGTVEKKFGLAYALQLFGELDASVRAVERRIAEENIACFMNTNGRFLPCASEAHLAALLSDLDTQRKHMGFAFTPVSRSNVTRELGTDKYVGGAIVHGLGGLHPGLYHAGLLAAARRAGVAFVDNTPVLSISGQQGAFRVRTSRGEITCRDVVIGTNGYTHGLLPWLDRRLIPFDAFMIATGPLSPEAMARAIPGGKVTIDSNHNALFVRPSPDGTRVLFGGLTGSALANLPDKGRHLQRMLGTLIPSLAQAELDTVWTGKCAATFDLFPHMGCHDGIYFAAGYCFVGVPMGTYLGTKIGQAVLGRREAASLFADKSFRSMPFYNGRPWFVPLVTRYWQGLDARTPSGAIAA
ncbi:FAD-binding oxidoreductase [Acetobacter sp. TBRC 12305]|uniref:FAD-binding oxidoreductase n=1 Tax=Acetobacter garciniae TaxID=2817435 RepID=A0A939KPQ7_9PROT|nr:FAD-binding oxidoreductase [Acetobacter garciniae]MBO1324237.1 FAD-binding oxidoreductase [Acetobacter garciniae]MBX0343926.1 FAD-binding oxidoreductase [Acetobacter garciniae]